MIVNCFFRVFLMVFFWLGFSLWWFSGMSKVCRFRNLRGVFEGVVRFF